MSVQLMFKVRSQRTRYPPGDAPQKMTPLAKSLKLPLSRTPDRNRPTRGAFLKKSVHFKYYPVVEFYLYPTVSTVLIHLIKPGLIR